MLVSSIARFNAINTMNNAAFMSVNASNNMVNGINNAHSFSGEHEFAHLNQMDKKISLNVLTNNLLYKVAAFQEKLGTKHQPQKLKSSVNFLA